MRFVILRARFHAPGNALPTQVIAQRAPGRFARVGFRIRQFRQAAGDRAPMIKDARNVLHLSGTNAIETAGREVVVLRTLVTFAEIRRFRAAAQSGKRPDD